MSEEVLSKSKFGIRVVCNKCGMSKKPRGRSAPVGRIYCDEDCEGYRMEPLVGDLWPGEPEAGFGFPCSNNGTILGRN